jgi:DNA-binding response OmpR family regulator
MRILVVEDEELMRNNLEEFLSQFFKVKVCDCVTYAICLLDKQDFDVILTDLYLGEINGLELIEVLKQTAEVWQRMPNLKLVLMSGRNVNIKNLPADVFFLAKPFDLNEIKEFIKKEAQ